MTDDAELVDRLSAFADRLPDALAAFAESLAHQRDRAEGEGEELCLTDSQRRHASEILTALALGREGKDLPAAVPAPHQLAELATRVRELRERKKQVEAELAEATEELVREIGVGAAVSTDDADVRVGIPRLSVRITDPSALPTEFLSLQPDRRAILEHVQEAAEVPPGAEVSETRPTVYFRARKGEGPSPG
jgi:hypothetical protein